MRLETTKVFSKNIAAINKGKKILVNQGGTRSSKSYSILQILYIIAKACNKKLIISVVSRALPHLKLGVMRDFDNILISHGEIPEQLKNKSNNTYLINKSIIEFFGTDQLGKVHGPTRDILFVNEANFIKHEVYDQLAIRTKDLIFIDFNPTREFWVHTELIPKTNGVELIKSTYLDNEFLFKSQIERIEAKKGNTQWWRVYGEGEVGQLEDAILTNWKYGEFDNTLPFGYGLDFGSRHPDAMVKCAVDRNNKKIYWKEEIFENGLSTNSLGRLVLNKVDKGKLIVADSAAPRSIQDLKGLGLNIVEVHKGRIVDDIKMLWDYEIIVDPESYNLAKELSNWVWLDKKGEIPIDEDDDLIDAGRYYARTIIKPTQGTTGVRSLNSSIKR